MSGARSGGTRASAAIRLIGDIPIYVAEESADVSRPPGALRRRTSSPAPRPDVSHPEGQLWGQPVYDWRAMRREGYRWWIERFRRTLELVDVARVDHFRGFVAYWAVPRGRDQPARGPLAPRPRGRPLPGRRGTSSGTCR